MYGLYELRLLDAADEDHVLPAVHQGEAPVIQHHQPSPHTVSVSVKECRREWKVFEREKIFEDTVTSLV